MGAMRRGAVIAVLAAMPVQSLAQCRDPLNKCEKALMQVSITWEERAKTQRARARNCETKLKTRTSTAIKKLTTPPAPPPKTEYIKAATITAAAAVLGFVLGVLAK